MPSTDLDLQKLQKRFGELRSAAHSLVGQARWARLVELLTDWPQEHLIEVVLPYLEDVLRGDTSPREAPARWYELDDEQLQVHPAFGLARSCKPPRLPLERLAVFLSSPHLQQLTCLDLSDHAIGDEGARAIANSPHLKKITSLGLSDNQLGEEGAAAIESQRPHDP